MTDKRFRSSEHLRRSADIERVFAQKRSASDHLLVVFVAENQLKWSRLAVSISKRNIRRAVDRNRVRRRIRECYRIMKSDLPPGLDIVCVARTGALRAKNELRESLRVLIAKAARKSPRSAADNRPRTSPPTDTKSAG